MRPKRVLVVGIVTIFLCTTASGIFLTTAVGAGFIGGFILGKITLGMFLAAMNSANQRPTASTSPNKASTRNQLEIPNSLETEVRTRFLRQLGKMDPLNCLPKVFCEVSADPLSATEIFGAEAMSLLKQTSSLHPKTKKTTSKETLQDSNEADDEEELDDVAEKVKEQKEKEEEDLENEGLEGIINDYIDPLTYYFILKEKDKPIHPQLMSMVKDQFASRFGALAKGNEKIKSKPSMTKLKTSEVNSRSSDDNIQDAMKSSIDDAFDNDPFFHSIEFTDASQQPQARGLVNVGLLRRRRRSNENDLTLEHYKMAAEVAESKDPQKCRKVFNTCPFSSEEVIRIITKLNSEEHGKIKSPNKKKQNQTDPSLTNLKNTLLVIEQLNDVTRNAEALGGPIDYSKIFELASKSTSTSEGSAKIVEDLKHLEDEFIPSTVPKKSTTNITKKVLKKTNTKKNKSRTRRHNADRLFPIRRTTNWENIEIPKTKFRLSTDRDDEFLAETQTFSKNRQFRRDEYQMEDSETDNENLPLLLKVTHQTSAQEGSDAQGRKVDDVEDDEFNSPESEEPTIKVPTASFTQTFMDSLGIKSGKRKPKPIHKVVKVRAQSPRSTSPAPNVTSTSKTKKPTTAPKPKQKFSGESEDDELDAIKTEQEIDALIQIPKSKPKAKAT